MAATNRASNGGVIRCIASAVSGLMVTGPALADTAVGGRIEADVTWTADASPYLVQEDIVVAAGASLNINPGVEVRFGAGLGLQVGDDGSAGTLAARGSEDAPIRFTSDASEPTCGDWSSIELEPSAVDATRSPDGRWIDGSGFEHVIIEFGGMDGTFGSVVAIETGPYMRAVTIQDSGTTGMFMSPIGVVEPVRIEDCVFDRCGVIGGPGGGIRVFQADGIELINCTMTDNENGSGAMLWFLEGAVVEGCVFSRNGIVSGVSGLSLRGSDFVVDDCHFEDHAAGAMDVGGNLLLVDSTFVNNSTTSFGGAISADGAGFRAIGCSFVGNSARQGGGIFVGVGDPAPMISGCEFIGNTATLDGGALYSRGGDGVRIDDCQFVGNHAAQAGGGVFSGTTGTDLRLSRCTFRDNVAGSRGGGLAVQWQEGVDIVGCTFENNDGGVIGGGGIALIGSRRALIRDSVVVNNFAHPSWGGGGGIHLLACHDAVLSGTRVEGNAAGRIGGGIHWESAGGDLSAGDRERPNRIVGNQSPVGSQVALDTPFTLSGRADVDAQGVDWGTDEIDAIETGLHDWSDEPGLAVIRTGVPAALFIRDDVTWRATDGPRVLDRSVIVGAGATLTIEAGVDVTFTTGGTIVVGGAWLGEGTLIARGTAANPVRFRRADDSQYFWSGLHLGRKARSAAIDPVSGAFIGGSILEHVILEGTGEAVWGEGVLTLDQSTPLLRAVTIRNGDRPGLRGRFREHQSLCMESCTIESCRSDVGGAGLNITGGTGHRFLDCAFIGNRSAGDTLSGGVQVVGGDAHQFVGCRFIANGGEGFSSVSFGAGLYVNGSYHVVEHCIFDGNRGSQSGGGLAVLGPAGSIVRGSTFRNNVGGAGAGAFVRTFGPSRIEDCTFIENRIGGPGDQFGGGVSVRGGAAVVHRNVFVNNIGAEQGGGVHIDVTASADVSSNLVSGNRSVGGAGGGIWLRAGDAALHQNDIRDNVAERGGGVYVGADTTHATLTENHIIGNAAAASGGAVHWAADGGCLAGSAGAFNVVRANAAPEGAAVTYSAADGRALEATDVCWGTVDADEIAEMIAGPGTVNFVPFVRDPGCGGESLCPGDVDGDGFVGFVDVLLVLANFGPCDAAEPCPADVTGDRMVDARDVLVVLGGIGACPE